MAEHPDIDAQDMAEVWDEDNQTPDMDRIVSGDAPADDQRPDLYDATRALGDADDDDAVIGEDLDDDELIALVGDEDADELDDDDRFTESADALAGEDVDDDDLPDDDRDDDDGVTRLGADEVALKDAGDMSNAAHAAGSAQRLESATLSDAQIEALGYGPDKNDAGRTAADQAVHDRQDALLDEGVEETFPASDPVSVKHIT